MATVQESACPACGAAGTLQVADKLVANPIGTFSLAGAQMKVTGRSQPVLTCSACSLSLVGEYDEDGRHVSFPQPVP